MADGGSAGAPAPAAPVPPAGPVLPETPELSATSAKKALRLVDGIAPHRLMDRLEDKTSSKYAPTPNIKNASASASSASSATVQTKYIVERTVNRVLYLRADEAVSQHFWHFMMGEFMPVGICRRSPKVVLRY